MRLFLKSNKVIETNNRITAILTCLRGGITGIYAQKKLNELDKELEIQNWKEFVKEIMTTFSNKTKAADAEWKIKTFKQENQNIANFMIKFNALAMKVDTDELHAIFFAEEECITRYHQDNIGISAHYSIRITQRIESGNHIGWPRV